MIVRYSASISLGRAAANLSRSHRPTYSKGKYDGAQRDAEHAGRGIWQGSYVEPWLFRACIGQGGKPGDCSDDANSHA
jgi:hypothetical protein